MRLFYVQLARLVQLAQKYTFNLSLNGLFGNDLLILFCANHPNHANQYG